jgi:hypothetical protein
MAAQPNFSCRIPNGDAQLVAMLRVAQGGGLFGRHKMRFADRVRMHALERQKNEQCRAEQMFHLNPPVH